MKLLNVAEKTILSDEEVDSLSINCPPLIAVIPYLAWFLANLKSCFGYL